MTESKKTQDFLRAGRHDRLLHELVHDPYKSKHKLPEPTVCPDCGAIFHHGRWQWGERPADAHEEFCPACHRMRDEVPAGFLTLQGEFFAAHKEEIMNLVHNIEAKAKKEHPIERIMGTEDLEDGIVITFTDAHLTRGVGEAIHHAFKGELDFHYTDEDASLRVNWSR
jgi:NMD protein affecting ribosome stability and mRNA decay